MYSYLKVLLLIIFNCCLTIAAANNNDVVRLELHFESMCKQCQIHIAGIDDIVIHGGDESSTEESGMISELSMSVDYYGTPDCIMNATKMDTEHGPNMCITDRVHLCAQKQGGGTDKGAGSNWFPFVHCMFMNMDQLKCGVNGHCDDDKKFYTALEAAIPFCATVSNLDGNAISDCAMGDEGKELALTSYLKTGKTLKDGFAAAYINGNKLENADYIWRKTPDQLLYGQTMLSTLCDALPLNSTPNACTDISHKNTHKNSLK
jgi:hypothetical protein